MPPQRDVGPMWAIFIKFLSIALIPTLSTVIVWGRDLEKRVNTHDVTLSTVQINVQVMRQSIDELRKDIAEANKNIRELQTSIAVLVARKESK